MNVRDRDSSSIVGKYNLRPLAIVYEAADLRRYLSIQNQKWISSYSLLLLHKIHLFLVSSSVLLFQISLLRRNIRLR